jgi:hypothetical protein
MNSRPWTAVMLSNDGFNKVRVVDEYAPISKKEAKNIIQEKHKGYLVVTLILGFHASHAHTFRSVKNSTQASNSIIDPFEMPGF